MRMIFKKKSVLSHIPRLSTWRYPHSAAERTSYRSISAADARAQQQTRRPPLLLSIYGTDTHTQSKTDGRTDIRPLHRPCSARYAVSVNEAKNLCTRNTLLADSKRLKNAKRRWLKKYACWLPSSWLNEHWTGGDVSLRKVFSQQFTERNDTIQIGLQKTRTDLGLRALKTWRKSA